MSMHSTYKASRLAVLLCGTAISSAWAQVPASVDPAKVERRFEPRIQPATPETSVVPATPAQSQQALQQKLAKQRFTLRDVTIEGNSVYTNDQLKFAYQEFIGKNISLADTQTIVRRITDYYRSHDYILSQAIVPPQDIKSGVLKIRVVEGYINDVRIEGDVTKGSGRKLVEAYANHIKALRPVRTSDLERYLLLMNDLPGASAKSVVQPSATQFGAADLVVTFEHKTYEGSYTFDNRGTKYIGPLQHSVTLGASSLLGLYERTLFRAVTTTPAEELRFFSLQHEEQIGTEGTRAIVDISHSHTRPGDSIKVLDIVGDSLFLQGKVDHPFIRSRQENLVGRVSFDVRNTETEVFNNVQFSDDRLRVGRIGAAYDFADRFLGVNLFDAQVSQGFNIFNASESGIERSRTNGESDFTKINLDITRTQPLPHNFSLLAAISSQYSFSRLLAAEQFTLGGVGFGQAYDPAELSGDHGVAARAELRWGNATGYNYFNSYQVYGYYDIGRVWIRDGGLGANDKRSLASTGLGIRTNFTDNLSGNVEMGVPLTKPASNQGDHGTDPRIFFSVTGRF